MTLNVGWLLEPSSHSARISFASASELKSSVSSTSSRKRALNDSIQGFCQGELRLDVGGAGAGDEAPVAQGMGGETIPAPAGYPTLPDPTLIE